MPVQVVISCFRSEEAKMPAGSELSLGDFVKQIAAKVDDMPFKVEAPWHALFFQLKQQRDEPGRPRFFDTLRFDWDGPYPKCRELSKFIRALHWNASASAGNPSFERIALPDEVGELWRGYYNDIDQEGRAYIDKAVELARGLFQKGGASRVA